MSQSDREAAIPAMTRRRFIGSSAAIAAAAAWMPPNLRRVLAEPPSLGGSLARTSSTSCS